MEKKFICYTNVKSISVIPSFSLSSFKVEESLLLHGNHVVGIKASEKMACTHPGSEIKNNIPETRMKSMNDGFGAFSTSSSCSSCFAENSSQSGCDLLQRRGFLHPPNMLQSHKSSQNLAQTSEKWKRPLWPNDLENLFLIDLNINFYVCLLLHKLLKKWKQTVGGGIFLRLEITILSFWHPELLKKRSCRIICSSLPVIIKQGSVFE